MSVAAIVNDRCLSPRFSLDQLKKGRVQRLVTRNASRFAMPASYVFFESSAGWDRFTSIESGSCAAVLQNYGVRSRSYRFSLRWAVWPRLDSGHSRWKTTGVCHRDFWGFSCHREFVWPQSTGPLALFETRRHEVAALRTGLGNRLGRCPETRVSNRCVSPGFSCVTGIFLSPRAIDRAVGPLETRRHKVPALRTGLGNRLGRCPGTRANRTSRQWSNARPRCGTGTLVCRSSIPSLKQPNDMSWAKL